jgi:protein O-GlcNAc transferase
MPKATTQEIFKLAVQHHTAGRLREAEQLYRQILAQEPTHVPTISNLGALAVMTGQNDIAVELLRQVALLKPHDAKAHSNLGNALKSQGRLDEAVPALRLALAINPRLPEVHNNLGAALCEQGFADEAVACCRQAIVLHPGYVEAYNNLGNALKDKAQVEEAIAAYRQAISLQPGFAQGFCNLGNALGIAGRWDESIAACVQAIRLKPDLAEAHNNLANALGVVGRLQDSIAACGEAIRLKPDLAEAHNSLGNALWKLGQLDEAVSELRQALKLKPKFAEAHSTLVYTLNCLPDTDPQIVLAEHREWADRHARALLDNSKPYSNVRDPDRRLRIGYVSGDFRRHSVSYFFIPLLENHDRESVEVFCYSNVQRHDEITERIKRSCHTWRDINGLSDDAAGRLVRSDGIDILVDLSGHSDRNRLRVFARKPAPVQVTYLGYPNTSGMTAIDYRLTDALADPPGMTDVLNVEKLWRLPGCAWCYEPLEDTPEIELRETGPITFGCFNELPKINRGLVASWSELLNRVPASHMLLKSSAMAETSAREKLASQFAEYGIDSSRLEMRGHTPSVREHLELYGRIDIALDTYPYHGTTTTCEALWMGVPVVTLAGLTHVSRVGVSLLTHAGLPELIAQTPEEYVSIASELAMNRPRLSALRADMRNKLRSSPLTAGPEFARNVEAAYRQMWRNWCEAGQTSGLPLPAK